MMMHEIKVECHQILMNYALWSSIYRFLLKYESDINESLSLFILSELVLARAIASYIVIFSIEDAYKFLEIYAQNLKTLITADNNSTSSNESISSIPQYDGPLDDSNSSIEIPLSNSPDVDMPNFFDLSFSLYLFILFSFSHQKKVWHTYFVSNIR